MSAKSTRIKQIPITEGFFTWPAEEPRLIGGKCKSCGRYSFPKDYPLHKIGCHKQDAEEVLLSKRGKLRSHTWQYYEPPPPYKGPSPFVPYGIAMVELPEGLNVVGIMTGCSREDLKMGMDVELEHGTVNLNTNVTDDNPLTTGKIALAHLNEFPDYYTRLKKMEKQGDAFWEGKK